jgi:MFS family permease
MEPQPKSPAARLAVLALVTFLTILPVTLVVPVLKGLVQDRYGVGELATSLFMSVNMLGAIVAAPLAGWVSDRLGRRKPLVLGGLCVDALLLMALAAAPSYAVLMTLRLFEGAAHAVALSVVLAMAADTARATGSGRAMGAVGASLTLGVALGAPLGGRLGELSASAPLWAGALLALLGAATAAAVLREDPQPARPRTPIGASLLRVRVLAVPYAFAFVDRFTVGFFVTTFPLWSANVHGHGPARIGAQLALFLLPFALLAYPAGRLAERTSRVGLLAGGSLLYGVAVIGLPWLDGPGLAALLVTLGVLSALMFVPNLMLTAELAPGELRASAMGGFNAAGSLGFLIGPAVAGWVSQTVGAASGAARGYQAAFAVAGLAEILCVLLTLGVLLCAVRG